MFGRPAKPMSSEKSETIAKAIATVDGLLEAHLPQCYITGDAEARQILVIGVGKKEDIPKVAEGIMAGFKGIFSEGDFIDILPYTTASLPSAVRDTKLCIFRSPALAASKPWWKFWK
jgi:hypothetical protein